jgi:hypothetical protein
VVKARGAHDQSGIVLPVDVAPTAPPALPTPDPTPLAVVAVGERQSAQSDATPAWKLALLALLAAAEAFLVVRLVRDRPGMLHPVQ